MSYPKRKKPGPGQESVWDYPRPPKLEPCKHRVQVVFKSQTIADSVSALRVLETSHPPVYYIPMADIKMEFVSETQGTSFCEWKGAAKYYTVTVGEKQAERAAWEYPAPSPAYAALKDHLAFYPSAMDACYIGGEKVAAQAGDFYGGWITSDIVGPFKGEPGTHGW